MFNELVSPEHFLVYSSLVAYDTIVAYVAYAPIVAYRAVVAKVLWWRHYFCSLSHPVSELSLT